MEERLLGTLYRWGPEGQVAEVPLDICKGDEIYIGRDVKCQYQILNGHVSSKHVYIYTVTFDEDDPDDVEPLVYAQNLSRFGTKWNAYTIHEQGESFLLSDGDTLEVTPGVTFRFKSASPTPQDLFSLQQNREMRLFGEEFVISPRCLGYGAYGRVHMAYRVTDGKQLACKIIDMTSPRKQAAVDRRDDGLSEFGVKQLVALRQSAGGDAALNAKIETCEREAKLLAGLKHPNIITLEAAFHGDHTLYIFVELATGGDLYSFIKLKGGKIEPTMAAGITLQLLLAVQYIHARNIVHRDIKPDNILTTSQQDGGRVILTDFGCARMVPEPTKRLSTLVGTKEYCAPEVFSLRKEGYTAAVDVWSVGRVTGTMLVGYSPRVEVDDDDEEMEEATGIQLLMSDLESMGLDGHPADFLSQLLNLEPEKRPSATAALGHAWFANLPNKHELEQRYQQSIRSWKSRPWRNFGTEHITHLTTANPFATYRPSRRCHTTPAPISEDYTLFPGDDHVSESSYGDAPPSRSHRTPLTHMHPSSNAHNLNSTVPEPAARRHNLMNEASAEPHTTLTTQQRDLQFLSQVERLHADPQLPKGNYLYIAPAELIPDPPTTERYPHLSSRVFEAPEPEPAPAPAPTDTDFFYLNPGVSFRLPQLPPQYPVIPPRPTEQRPAHPNTPDSQGQVYEDPVTGGRRRFIYGRWMN